MATNNIVEKAEQLAKTINRDRLRIAGDLFSDHTKRVANLLLFIGVNDDETLCGAHLHHALDFYDPKIEKTLLEDFGSEIYKIIQDYHSLTESNFSSISPENINESILIQNYLNLAKNPKTLLIRLADKSDNIQSAHVLSPEESIKIAERAIYIYAPICKILGISKLARILDDGGFKILNPKEYYKINSYIEENYPSLNSQIEDAKDFIKDILEENYITPEIEARAKGIYSTYKKLRKYQNLRDIKDIGAIRLIVDTEEQCYKTEDILKSVFELITDSRDDYIAHPKQNGYKSLQASYQISPEIILEIQIRTHEMHAFNEHGLASHAAYKIGEVLQKDLERNPSMLKEISYSLNKEQLNIQQFTNNVYVYTPKGAIKKLPRGANIIDFAYLIHQDLGNGCIGAFVNGEFKPVTYELNDGDRVFVKADKTKKKPSQKWLEIAKTYKAKAQIRKALKEK